MMKESKLTNFQQRQLNKAVQGKSVNIFWYQLYSNLLEDNFHSLWRNMPGNIFSLLFYDTKIHTKESKKSIVIE